MKHLTLLAACLIFLCAPLAVSSAQQRTSIKTEDIYLTVPAPIKITSIPLKTRKTRAHRSASENGSWVIKPVVQVENISGKTIEYLTIEIGLPEAKSSSAKDPLMLAYGQTHGQKSLSSLGDKLQPGAKVSLTVSRNACDAVKQRFLATHPRHGSRVTARINGVVFTDGTAWFDGLLHVADPTNPSRWNVVEKSSTQADFNDTLKFAHASYRADFFRAPQGAPCWKRLGTEWHECCGGMQVASAIMVNVWGGIFEPFPMSIDCGDGTYCEWIKQVGCSNNPEGGD